MDSYLMFLNCPAYMDKDGAARCGLPAEVHCRYTMNSTDGPLESAKIRCPLGHWFNGPIEYLTVPQPPTAPAARTWCQGGWVRVAAGDGRVVRDVPGGSSGGAEAEVWARGRQPGSPPRSGPVLGRQVASCEPVTVQRPNPAQRAGCG